MQKFLQTCKVLVNVSQLEIINMYLELFIVILL